MRRWIIGALLAATAWAPAAQAQDDEFRGASRGDFSEQRRNGTQPRADRQQAQPVQQQQPRFQRQADGGWTGRRERGPADAGGQNNWQGRRDRGPADVARQGDWQGRRDGGRPQTFGNGNPADQTRFGDRAERRDDGRDRNRGDWNRGGRPDLVDRNRDGRPGPYNRDGRRQWDNRQPGRQGWDNRRYDAPRTGSHFGNSNWTRSWRNDNRYDWLGFRASNRNAFRLPRYYAPYGWDYGYRRFSIGVTLSSVLWGQDYWIDDPYDYRLPEAYGDYRWVRYFNDALLVDLRTGQVVDTVYDIFY